MKKLYLLFILLPFISIAQHSDFIHVDQFGYRTNSTKVAVISNPQIGFNSALNYIPSTSLQVRDFNTDAVVYTGNISSWNNGSIHSQSGDIGWWFDFSSITTPGLYYIYDPSTAEASAAFEINDTIYDNVLKVATKMFYYNRANMAKAPPYVQPQYTDGISFTQDEFARDVYDQNNTSTTKDMRGGWFDAGDNNKYVTFAETAVHDLLWAYRMNPEVFGDDYNIPESGNGIPDILDEIKWETDWLLKMTNPDGSVHIKVGNRNYGENVNTPPSSNNDIRYYAPTCTSASLANASMLAHVSKVFEQFPSLNSYAEILKDNAELCWQWVLPYLNNDTLEENCDDGSVVAGDADRSSTEQRKMALTAAVYLYDLTGNSIYNDYIIDNINDAVIINNNQWDNYELRNIDALLHYTTLSNADNTTRNLIIASAESNASNNYNNYYQFNELDLYRGYCNDWTYHWGSNNSRASMGNLNLIIKYYGINTSSNSSYGLRAKEILHYFHGVNPLDLVYLSAMEDYGAENSLKEIYHFWFADGSQWDNADITAFGPAPGYLSGGCNQNYTANTNLTPPYNQPPQKSYLDFNTSNPDNSWEISEPAIYYQAAYVRLLSGIARLNEDDTLSNNEVNSDLLSVQLAPNPAVDGLKLNGWNFDNSSLKIFSINGKEVLHLSNFSSSELIDVSNLTSGFYILFLSKDNVKKHLKFIKN